MSKGLNVKNMKETLVNYCGGDIKEYNEIFDTFRNMANYGFIDHKTWMKFFEETIGWTIEGEFIFDYNSEGEFIGIVFDFDNGSRNGSTGYVEYKA